MNQQELDVIKQALKRQDDALKELWLEKQLPRNLILDSNWMAETELDAAIENAKRLPENIRQVAEHFASSDQKLAEIGLADWLAELARKHPRTE